MLTNVNLRYSFADYLTLRGRSAIGLNTLAPTQNYLVNTPLILKLCIHPLSCPKTHFFHSEYLIYHKSETGRQSRHN